MTKNKKMIQLDTSFFLNNNTKTCTISRFIKGIKLLACNLGTEFAVLCTIYYLLYGSEIFSDFLFLQEVTVQQKKFKKSLISAVKLILNFFTFKPEVCSCQTLFPLQNGLNEFCRDLPIMFT